MSARSEARDAAAAATLQIHSQLGITFGFSNNGEAAVTLIGSVGPGQLAGTEEVNADAEEDIRTFYAARQTSFPPDTDASIGGIRIESEITYESSQWEVLSITESGGGAVYAMTARRLQPTRLGRGR